MAMLDIASVSPQMDPNFNAKVLGYKIVEDGKYAIYTIQITVDSYIWTVERRYSEFDALDQNRFSERQTSFLPPKKILGNMDEEFLEERKRELEKYIRAMLELEVWHQKQKRINSLPLVTARFLDFHQYEIHSIVDDLSVRLGKVGDEWISSSHKHPKYFEFTPIELFAITERLRLPEPTAPENERLLERKRSFFTTLLQCICNCAIQDSKMTADIGNTIDFLHRVVALKVRGSRGCVGTSNIFWHSLEYSLHFCKSILALWITHSDVARIRGVDTFRKTLRRIVVHYSMENLKDLLCDEEPPVPIAELEPWSCLEEADFSFNELVDLDETVRLLGPVKLINLSHNNIKDIGFFVQHLSSLVELRLSHNNIVVVDDWNIRLGNLKKLDLQKNSIKRVEGLSKLYSLEELDVRDNQIDDMDDVHTLGRLPCMHHLLLRGNPVRDMIDYRSKVLEAFGERSKEVLLDGRVATAREMDTIRVRLALKQAKREKDEKERRRREKIEEASKYISGEVESCSLNG